MKKIKIIIAIIVIIAILLGAAFFVLKNARYYKKSETCGMTNIILNNNNITLDLKRDFIIKDDVVFLSKQDIANFFDVDIYYDETEKRIITTSYTKVASLVLDNPEITINGKRVTLKAAAFQADDEKETIYLPFSELEEVYNLEIVYNKKSEIVTIDSLSREQMKATVSKNTNVNAYARGLSRADAKVNKGDTVIFVSSNEGWSKIRTSDGIVGYVKDNCLSDKTTVREKYVEPKQIEGKINMVWDYYSVSASAPNRNGTKMDGVNVVSPTFFQLDTSNAGEVVDKVRESGKSYIKWAKSNDYKVWGLLSNENMTIDGTSKMLNSYSLRTRVIENLLELAEKYDLDGINIDFEAMYKNDKDMFSQFIIELYPRLKEKNMVLSVDVTAPDGGEIWSECYDRLVLGRNCHYVVFMAYDQYGDSSTKAGTTAGYDWVKVNVNKFLKKGGIDEVPAEKLILAIPFYTKVWTENASGKLIKNNDGTVSVAPMKNIKNIIPSSATITWLDDVRQNYAEWKSGSNTKKMWIEDEKSIREKISIIRDNNLAGAAFWAKDREPDSIWKVIQEELNK